MEENRFAEEIVPVVYKDRKGNEITVDRDEHPRPDTTLEKLGKLKPYLKAAQLQLATLQVSMTVRLPCFL